MVDDCSAVILAGGAGRRMGMDKADLMLNGETLLHRAIRRLQPHFSTLLISVRHPRPSVTLPQLCDPSSMAGPMAGIIAALRMAKTRWLFAVACDMPFVSENLIRALATYRRNQPAVVAEVGGVLQPLFGFYAADALPLMERNIAAGKGSLQYLLREQNITTINEAECRRHDPELLSFMDLDTIEDTRHAERRLRQQEVS